MTHFNHEWDTTKTPAIPMSVGDRYYAQDLNDDFNYLKHLPYEVFLQGRSRGVMIAPSDTWNNDTNSLTLSGGFGVILQDNIELDPDESFVIPPKTHTSPRYERIPFINATLTLPNDNATHYIVVTPTKRSLLQRVKALVSGQYASRVRYDGVVSIQDTAPTADQILIGLCNNKEYCLLVDNNINQCKDNIILKKWFGQNKITQGFVSILQSYYNTTIASIETKISIDIAGYLSIQNGVFNHCTISIDTANNLSTYGNIFNYCIISINTVSSNGGYGIGNVNTLNHCIISIDTVSNSGVGINGGNTLNYCTISIGTVNSSVGIYDLRGTNIFNHCIVSIDTVNGGNGVNGGVFNHCIISINTVSSGEGVSNNSRNILYLTRINCSAVVSLSSTRGKLNVLNDTVLHTS